MTETALVQARIDPDIRDRASEVLQRSGLTVSDAVRILLTRTANEGALPLEVFANDAAYDAWFRAKVQEAIDDSSPRVPGEDVEAEFARRRAAVAAVAKKGSRHR